MNKKLSTVWVFARLSTRRFFRDKLALFFGIAFPVIFLVIFGLMFGSGNGVSFRVALLNQSHTSFATQFSKEIKNSKIFKVDSTITTLSAANEKMTRSQLDATLVLPANFGESSHAMLTPSGTAKVIFTQNNEQAGQAIVSVLDAQFKAVNRKF